MNVRKFIAPTIALALADVKRELGAEAIILRTRTVRKGGMLTFFTKDAVEVMAASPDRNPPESLAAADPASEIRRRLECRPSDTAVTELKNELSELKGHIREIADYARFERMPSLPPLLAERFKDLVRSGVDQRLAAELTEQVNLNFTGDQLENAALVDRELTRLIAGRVKVSRPTITLPPLRSRGGVGGGYPKKEAPAKVVALIGPTGVGKTTTLAKLVTNYRFWGGCDTAIVSADTYRVAALEQIKTFAAIAGLPMESVYQPAAMPTALGRHKQRDAVFVDTPGRSALDAPKLDELAAFLDAAEADERLLCLAINTRAEDQLDIIERYGRLKPTGIIFTKLDDSQHPGGALSVAERCDVPLAYLTCGQNVPDDIISADAGRIAELLLSPGGIGRAQKERFESWIAADELLGRGGINPDG